MKIQNKHIIAWLESCATHLTEQQDFLTALDRDIGDADHGLNMNRGFSAVKAILPDIERQHIGNILKNTGMKLLSSVGGASGPSTAHYLFVLLRRSEQNGVKSGRVAGVSGRRNCRSHRARKSRTRGQNTV